MSLIPRRNGAPSAGWTVRVGRRRFRDDSETDTADDQLTHRLPAVPHPIVSHGLTPIPWLHHVDLRQSRATAIFSGTFCKLPLLQVLNLPSTLAIIGNNVLCQTGLQRLDLSYCPDLTSIGDGFLNDTPVVEFHPPSSLLRLGSSACRRSALRELDLSETTLQYIEPFFLEGTACLQRLRLPACLQVICHHFCNNSSLPSLDIRHCAVQEIGDYFLRNARVDEVFLPRVLQEIGDCAFHFTKITCLDLRHTVIEKIGRRFVNHSPVHYVSFPRTLRQIGPGFHSSRFRTVAENDNFVSLLRSVRPPMVEYETLEEALSSSNSSFSSNSTPPS